MMTSESSCNSATVTVTILVRFWGTRGSLPAPLSQAAIRAKMHRALIAARGRYFDSAEAIDAFIDRELPFSVRGTFGGNSSCVEIAIPGKDYFLCDSGSGLREFGATVMGNHGCVQSRGVNIFLSHLHWDHIMGFPFFAPTRVAGAVIRVYGCHEAMREAFEQQQCAPHFSVGFHELKATIKFVKLEPGRVYDIEGILVTPIRQHHEGDSYGYRFVHAGKTVVYSTDNEDCRNTPSENVRFLEFCHDADLLIFDTMYTFADTMSAKAGWGHSSNMSAVKLAHLAGIKQLVLFQHEPAADDATLEAMLNDTRRYEEIFNPRIIVAMTTERVLIRG
jgi:phosphoribosyl 1,2-cyclic phosphodiesterase